MSSEARAASASPAATRNRAIAAIPPAWLGRVARRLYTERRERDQALACDLLHEGAWDLLLDLYACTAAGQRVCITSACAAACVPATTAQRLVTRLEKNDLIGRVQDERDRRIRYLVLTATAERILTRYLESIAVSRRCWTNSDLALSNSDYDPARPGGMNDAEPSCGEVGGLAVKLGLEHERSGMALRQRIPAQP